MYPKIHWLHVLLVKPFEVCLICPLAAAANANTKQCSNTLANSHSSLFVSSHAHRCEHTNRLFTRQLMSTFGRLLEWTRWPVQMVTQHSTAQNNNVQYVPVLVLTLTLCCPVWLHSNWIFECEHKTTFGSRRVASRWSSNASLRERSSANSGGGRRALSRHSKWQHFLPVLQLAREAWIGRRSPLHSKALQSFHSQAAFRRTAPISTPRRQLQIGKTRTAYSNCEVRKYK